MKELIEVLNYCPDTGIFTWKVKPSNGVEIGDRAGTIDSQGHRQIRYKRKAYLAHRVAWFFMTGEEPKSIVDHRNTICDDNRWSNLRLATNAQNCANTKIYSNNSSGVKGVHSRRGKWSAYIDFNGRRWSLGTFDTIDLAAEFRELAADLIHGEFANKGVFNHGLA